ncbi:MAG: hypothetical protein EOP19_19245, partial [Hyphomicrobiales bacterium]
MTPMRIGLPASARAARSRAIPVRCTLVSGLAGIRGCMAGCSSIAPLPWEPAMPDCCSRLPVGETMSAQIETSIEGQLGVIALNRPEAINALNLPMIEAIAGVLRLWEADDKVRAVLFEGRGSRGFCAGGDVRAAREAVLRGDKAAADRFFSTEYAMNRQIATYAKPVAVIADGVVMGGGLGIAGHAQFRFTTPNARFAMPEAAIGFVCDVGVNAILRKAPLQRALLFELSGQTVGAADALALGLTDCAVAPDRLGEVRASIIAAAGAQNIEAALVGLMETETIQAGERVLCDLADRLEDELLLADAAAIVAAIGDSGEAPDMARLLASRSPTS